MVGRAHGDELVLADTRKVKQSAVFVALEISQLCLFGTCPEAEHDETQKNEPNPEHPRSCCHPDHPLCPAYS